MSTEECYVCLVCYENNKKYVTTISFDRNLESRIVSSRKCNTSTACKDYSHGPSTEMRWPLCKKKGLVVARDPSAMDRYDQRFDFEHGLSPKAPQRTGRPSIRNPFSAVSKSWEAL